MTLIQTVPLLALAAVLAACAWVYRDARAHADAGIPVVVELGSFRVDTPQVWTVSCLVLFVVAFPLYMAARNA